MQKLYNASASDQECECEHENDYNCNHKCNQSQPDSASQSLDNPDSDISTDVKDEPFINPSSPILNLGKYFFFLSFFLSFFYVFKNFYFIFQTLLS